MTGERTAIAQPPPELSPYRPAITDPEDLPVKKKSYFVPAAEILLLNLSMITGARIAQMHWGQSDLSTIRRNLTTMWELDDDAFSTNQLGHPFGGALLFSTARSTGHGFFVSGLYALAGSTMWEVFLENEIPSINDQITTPIGGMFIGEAMHRFGRALLYRSYGRRSWPRKLAASLVDPVGAVNRAWWGDAWAKTIPPNVNAYFGAGFQQPTTVLGNHGGPGQLHLEVYVEHGLAGDRAFQPRRPLDHFVFQAAINIVPSNVEGLLYVRGMLLGTGMFGDRVRGMAGLFGAYDYNNNDFTRASMLGVGPGTMAELRITPRGYLNGTIAAYGVPYGSAGGVNETVGPMRDHHDGPGLAQLVEVKGGVRGLFSLRLTTRAYQIAGRLVNDHANELVVNSTAAARVNFTPNQGIGVEGTWAYRHASFADAAMNPTDRTADFRLFYALTTDEVLGR
ncbi:MAG: DUF3943 domain-containing protein [Kofleriaceae bacterium]|nr:DUF3943 domain-containing protein [Kofleriaceae bacterium]